jgi:hypothetical protein
MPFMIEELSINKENKDELERVFTILSDILERDKNGIEVTEHEKEFFSSAGIKLSMIEGTLDDYTLCSNFKFTDLYLSYWYDLTGGSLYTKMDEGKEYEPLKSEVECDIKYLHKYGLKWESTIKKTNHTEKLLQEVSKETRDELKKLKKRTGRTYFKKQVEDYKLNKLTTILQSKYIYCRALLIFEKFQRHDFMLTLNNHTIEIDEFSIVHILSQHYGAMTKFDKSKLFHNEDFEPDYLNMQLAEIFKKIDNSNIFGKEDFSKLRFQYQNVIYQIFINKRIKQVGNVGNIEYNRLETFYPVKKKKDLDWILKNHNLIKVDDEISVFIKKYCS